MAFVKVKKNTRVLGPSDKVRIGCHLQTDKQPRGIYLSIGIGIIEQVGWAFFETESRKTIRMDISEGTGDDAGFLLLSEGDMKAYALGTEKRTVSGSFGIGIGINKLKHYVLNECPVDVDDVDYTVDVAEKSILVQCPDWLRYNPQSVKEPEPPELPPPSLARQLAEVKKEASRPTLRDVNVVDPNLNRKERRQIAHHVARALRK